MNPADRHIASLPLLCRRCGYEIEGLQDEPHCPECGEPIARSLPSARPGSPWQQRQKREFWTAWTRTAWAALRSPKRQYDLVRVDRPSATALIRINTRLVALQFYILLTAVVALTLEFDQPEDWAWFAVLQVPTAVAAALLALLVFTLIWIEHRGLRFFGRVHRRRVTPDVAWTVVSHASFGWVLGGLLVMTGLALSKPVQAIAVHHNVGLLRGPILLAPLILPALGGFAGMLVFETLCWIGVHRCRYANAPRPTSDRTAEPERTYS